MNETQSLSQVSLSIPREWHQRVTPESDTRERRQELAVSESDTGFYDSCFNHDWIKYAFKDEAVKDEAGFTHESNLLSK